MGNESKSEWFISRINNSVFRIEYRGGYGYIGVIANPQSDNENGLLVTTFDQKRIAEAGIIVDSNPFRLTARTPKDALSALVSKMKEKQTVEDVRAMSPDELEHNLAEILQRIT